MAVLPVDSERNVRSSLSFTLGCFHDVCGLRTLLALGDFELHLVPFLQALVALRTDRAVMYKNIRAICAPNEPVPLGVIEPLYGPFQSFHEPLLSARPIWAGRRAPQSMRCILRSEGKAVKKMWLYKS